MTPPYFLNFCDYLPFEEDLAFHLNKLKFPSPEDRFAGSQGRIQDFKLGGAWDCIW
jgi:hypothetical protein